MVTVCAFCYTKFDGNDDVYLIRECGHMVHNKCLFNLRRDSSSVTGCIQYHCRNKTMTLKRIVPLFDPIYKPVTNRQLLAISNNLTAQKQKNDGLQQMVAQNTQLISELKESQTWLRNTINYVVQQHTMMEKKISEKATLQRGATMKINIPPQQSRTMYRKRDREDETGNTESYRPQAEVKKMYNKTL
jgi:hypothetical protein